MEYSATQQTETMTQNGARRVQLIGARAMGEERVVSDEPRFVLNARGQAFVADTLGIVCDGPLSNAEISMIAEKIEQNLCDSVPHASLLIQLAVVGQTSAEISRLTNMSPATASRCLRAIRRASSPARQAIAAPVATYEPELLEAEAVLLPVEQPQEATEEVSEVAPVVAGLSEIATPTEQAEEVPLPDELPVEQFHSVTAGSLRGGIYRALKEHGVKGYGVIEESQLSEFVEAALAAAAAPYTDRQAYRGYLRTNKPLFIDNPARPLMTEMPKLIAELIVQQAEARPATVEPVAVPSVAREQLSPVHAVRRRVGRTAVARTPLRPVSTSRPEATRRLTTAEQLPLDVIAMNRLRGGVFRSLRGFGVALPSSLEHDQLHDYAQRAMTDKTVTPEVQAAYDTYLRTCTYVRSDTELSQVVIAMPEWIARQIMSERGATPGEPVGPEVLPGQKELHMAERQRLAAIATAELDTARAYLSGTEWERRQALVSVGGDTHWLALFDTWRDGGDLDAIAADFRYDTAMVRRRLLHMAKAATRQKPATVTATPADHWVKDALCAQTDPEIFFPEKGGSTRDAKKVCDQCQVRAACEATADYHHERFGIWARQSKAARKR